MDHATLVTPPFEFFFASCRDCPWERACQNLRSISLATLELLAFNSRKFTGSHDHGHAPFSIKFSGFLSGLSLEACVPNMKFVSLIILEPLSLNAQKFTGPRDPDHAPAPDCGRRSAVIVGFADWQQNRFFYSEVEMLRSQWIALKYCMQYDRPPFWKSSEVMLELSLWACMPNLKSVSVAILELLALNSRKFTGLHDLTTPPF